MTGSIAQAEWLTRMMKRINEEANKKKIGWKDKLEDEDENVLDVMNKRK